MSRLESQIIEDELVKGFDALEETTYQGNEFVVTVDDLEAVSYPLPPRRGDQIENADFGTNSVTEVVPQVTLGEVIGYRLRVG